MFSDFRLAFRSLRKSPGFTTVAILTLALGLGVNITVFGIVDDVLLRPLPVRAPQELAFLMQYSPRISNLPFPLSFPDWQDLRARVESTAPQDAAARDTFSGLAAYAPQAAHLSEPGRDAERGWVHEVSDNYFSVLGVGAAVGRVFAPGEGVSLGADPVAVLSHRYWVRRYAADPHVIGTKLMINGAPFTIIGVTARDFGGAEAMTAAEVFVPATMADVLRPARRGVLTARGSTGYMVIARLQPGVSAGQAQSVADGLLQSLIKAYPNDHVAATARVVPEAGSRPTPYVSHFTKPAITATMLLAMLVLAVAAANITNLLYARATAAERSLAIRSALGASRLRLIRQLLAESVLLAVAAAFVGWGASQWFGTTLAGLMASADNPPLAEPTGTPWPVLFTALAAVGTGIATGLLPALRATRLEVVTLLKDGAPSSGRARHPFRTLLVGAQIALACVVLVGAGLTVQSLRALNRVELGFRPENLLMATFDLEMQRYGTPAAESFQHVLLQRVRALPGVVSAGLARSVPFDRHYGMRSDVGAEGFVPPKDDLFPVVWVQASPGFQETMRIPLLAGRSFTDADDAKAPNVAIVTQSLARHFWPGRDPIGRFLTAGRPQKRIQVVGVTPDIRYFMLGEPGKPQLFLPLAQEPSSRTTLVVRTEGSPVALASSIEAIGHQLDPGLPIHHVTTFENHIATSPLGSMVQRFGTIIVAVQGGLVLLLSIIGIYGLVSFGVSQRTREIGIRMALGANLRNVVSLVTRPTLTLTLTGLVLGLVTAGLLSIPLRSLLYGRASGVPVMLATALLLTAASLLACWIPARRAMRINPTEALRTE